MAKKDNKRNLIIGACAAIVAIIVIVVAIVLATSGNKLNDAYFVSDDTKYVLTIDGDATDSEEYTPLKTHLVYTYSGDEITGLKAYYEYADAATAKQAYDYFKANADEQYKSVAVDGKYVILEANESEYEGATASDVKQQVELMEMLKNMNLESGDEEDATDEAGSLDEETTDEETETTTEDEE